MNRRLLGAVALVLVAGIVTVLARPGPPLAVGQELPVLLQVAPNVTGIGESVAVTVTGRFTHFLEGTTVAHLGDVVVHGTTVQSATEATVFVTPYPGILPGPRDVTIVTGAEVVSLAAGFTVGPGRVVPPGDFDGDGRSDVSVFRPSTGAWYTLESSTGVPRGRVFGGTAADITVSRDFDGDARADLAIYRQPFWFLAFSNSGGGLGMELGIPGDIPAPADYDGDRRADVAVYRPSHGAWYYRTSSTNFTSTGSEVWGTEGDIPVPADYVGGGVANFAVFRPSTGHWFILKTTLGVRTPEVHLWGIAGDVPVVGDYDGDRKSDIAVYRPSSGAWYFLKSSTGFQEGAGYLWGIAGDVPVSGDYDGDGKADLTVFRPSTGAWFTAFSSSGYTTASGVSWGAAGDVPVPRQP